MAFNSGVGSNSGLTLDGLFKQVYADKISKLVPLEVVLQKLIDFLPKERQPGAFFNQMVSLQLEHGITYGGDSDTAFELRAPISGQSKNAQVRGYQMTIRSAIPYTSITRSAQGGEKSFMEATKYIVGNMIDSFSKKLEVELMYGQSGLGKVKNIETAGASVVVEIKDSEWAPGIWSGAEGMKVDIFRAGVVVAGNTDLVISGVDFDAKTVTLATLAANTAVDDDIFPAGAHDNQMVGLHAIMTNTSTLFGISAATYNLWKASTFTPGTPGTPVVLTFAIIQQAIARGLSKGLSGNVKCLVNPSHWDDLLTEQAASRRFDSSYKSGEVENGAKGIKFYSQNGEIEILASLYVKEGYSYVFSTDDYARVGSMDLSLEKPGMPGKFMFDLPSHNGYEIRAISDQSLFSAKPGRSVLINNLKIG